MSFTGSRVGYVDLWHRAALTQDKLVFGSPTIGIPAGDGDLAASRPEATSGQHVVALSR